MGSTFITLEDKTIPTVMGREEPVPIYMQFVPGVVLQVITSATSADVSGQGKVNSIIAKPYYTEKVSNRTSEMYHPDNTYIPLLRGIVDTPAKGDPVLLCTFGGTNYYMGPLNSDNSPCFNRDTSESQEYNFTEESEHVESTGVGQNEDIGDLEGAQSPNFVKESVNRMEKPYIPELDHPHDELTGEQDLDDDGDPLNAVPGEIHGDMLFEGRYGNSIRIGSRHIYPNIVLSNGRDVGNVHEGIGDACFIGMTSEGTLAQLFGSSGADIEDFPDHSGDAEFKLSSDNDFDIENLRVRTIFDLIQSLNEEEDIDERIYKYRKPQMLFTSDRIIINTRVEDLFLSSNRNINISTGKNLNISTNEDLIIESRNIYLGKASYLKKIEEDSENPPEPLVLGEQLVNLFKDLIDTLMETQCLTPAGSPVPVMDSMMAPIKGDGVDRKGLTTIKGELNKILSIYHYIENNGDIKEIMVEKPEEE